MHQLTQQLKSGKMEILEVPFPSLGEGQVLVRNIYSVISAGTEGKTVTDARKGYIAKARSRQKEVKQIIEMIKTIGLKETYNLVMNKLEAPSPLGYSCAGEIIAVGEGIKKLHKGDFVACGGSDAHHADVIAVPVNLAVKVPKNVDLKQAAFTTLASIAIQGIRQADLKLGENCLIIGMGIIGMLTYKILEASGIFPIGIDISDIQVKQSHKSGMLNVYNRYQYGIDEIIENFSKGVGVDAVIITASSASVDPVEFAGAAARQKAKIVIVGNVPTGFSRGNYYKKELDLRMSTSYGPGRYDSKYEEKGIDYPVGYVRWTENRNMQSFIDLLESKRLDILPLISHTFPFEKAPEAFDMILARSEPFGAVLIQYEPNLRIKKEVKLNNNIYSPEDVNIGLIGAGSFAQGFVLPNIKGLCNLIGVATKHGNTAKYVGSKYEFKYCASNADDLVADKEINTLFITTRHNLHAEYVIKGLSAGKHIYVEKPLAMNEGELKMIKTAYEKQNQKESSKHLMVGFNRRFAPAVQELKNVFIKELPKAIVIRINAGTLPVDHWVNDPEIGGGRIIGEVCHFIDLAMFLADSPIVSVSADALHDSKKLNNTVVINLSMANGSIASIDYFSNGNKKVPKEYIEVFGGTTYAQIDDFKTLKIIGNKTRSVKYKGNNKGHANELQAFLESVKKGGPCPIPFQESYLSMYATFKVIESIAEKKRVVL